AAAGPARELARVDFGGAGHSIELTKRDLRVLKDEGLIHFRWDFPDRGTGRMSGLASSAVSSNFHDAVSGDAAALAATALKLAAWLVALSIWTEWHAAHHPKPDPCA